MSAVIFIVQNINQTKTKKNWYKNRPCYYFDDIIKIEDFNFGSILIHEKSYENILDDNISYKFLIGTKPLRIRLDKVEGFIRVYDGTRYLVYLQYSKIWYSLQ